VRSHPLPHALAWPYIAVITCVGVLGCQSCMSGEPARQEAPRSPAPPPAAPAQPQAESPEGEADKEMRREEPASDESSLGAPKKAEPSSAAKARSRSIREQNGAARGRAAPAPAPAEAPGAADDALTKGHLAQPEQLMERLDRAMRSGAADCPSAETRKKAVCDLAGQICQLVDRDPNVASVVQYCADAKERCSEASRRTRERCER
jgi:hypothetical protein